MNRGICKLCKTEKDLCESHIIPKLAYKPIQDSINKSVPISCNNVFQAVQSGIKEPLLCLDCKGKISKYETELKFFLTDLQNGNPNKITRHSSGTTSLFLTKDYDY